MKLTTIITIQVFTMYRQPLSCHHFNNNTRESNPEKAISFQLSTRPKSFFGGRGKLSQVSLAQAARKPKAKIAPTLFS
jgi:hypothetical protein